MENTFITSRGIQVTFLSITNLLIKLSAQFPLPEPPTYEVKTATGVVERHPHDETTLETDADKAAWAEFQQALARHGAEFFNAQMRLCLTHGIRAKMPADDGWIREQELIGFKVPMDPRERRLHWLETEVAATNDDLLAILAGVGRASGINEEAVQQLEDSFRRALGWAKRDTAGPAGQATAPDDGTLDREHTLRAGGNGAAIGDTAAERV